jgi:hypothetical protein
VKEGEAFFQLRAHGSDQITIEPAHNIDPETVIQFECQTAISVTQISTDFEDKNGRAVMWAQILWIMPPNRETYSSWVIAENIPGKRDVLLKEWMKKNPSSYLRVCVSNLIADFANGSIPMRLFTPGFQRPEFLTKEAAARFTSNVA